MNLNSLLFLLPPRQPEKTVSFRFLQSNVSDPPKISVSNYLVSILNPMMVLIIMNIATLKIKMIGSSSSQTILSDVHFLELGC